MKTQPTEIPTHADRVSPCSRAASTVRSPATKNVVAALALLACSALSAQVAPAPSTAATSPTNPEVVRMVPFETIEKADDSFVTQSVGTGGRLVLDLKDVPAQYSVINRAFIDALGITDMTEAASWAPGQTFQTDSGVSVGNFDGQYGRFTQRGITQVTTPNTTGTSGASNGVMKNFYQNNFSGNQDSYAVESFDFGQGPNGILFGGAGSMGQFQASAAGAGLAGVSSSQTKRARLDRPLTSISAEFGSFQYKRYTLDTNIPLSQRVGVRINLLDLDAKGYRFHQQDMKRGVQATATWRMSPTSDFSLTASIDKASNNYPSLAQENISGWDGTTVARGLIDTTMMPTTDNLSVASLSKSYGSILGTGGTPVSFGGEPNGVARFSTIIGFGGQAGNDSFVWDQSTNTIVNWRGMLVTRRANSTSRVPLWSATAPNGASYVQGTRGQSTVNGVTALADQGFGVSANSYLNMQSLPGDMFARALNNSKYRNMGPRDNLSWDGDSQVARNKDLQFSFAQSLGSHMAVGMGGDWNVTVNSGATMDRPGSGVNALFLDINQVLPNGSPNPHFLEMFSQSGTDGMNDQNSRTEDKALRANFHIDHNFGRWGNYTFNVNGNINTRTYDFRFYQLYITSAPNDPALNSILTDPRAINNGMVRMQMYQSNNGFNLRFPKGISNFTLINSNWAGTGAESNTNAYIPTPVTSQVTTRFMPSLLDTGFHRAVFQSFHKRDLTFQTTASWFNGKAVFLGGYRRDFNSNLMRQQMAGRYYPTIDTISRPEGFEVPLNARWDGVTTYWKPVFRGTPAEYSNLSFRTRDASGNQVGSPRLATTRPTTTLPGGKDGGNLNGSFAVDDPRYASDHFRDDYSPPEMGQYGSTKTYGITFHPVPWLSPFINKSDQIIPIGLNSATSTTPNIDMFGNLQKDVIARGTDIGTQFNFFNGKVTGRYNYFHTNRYNNPATNNVIGNINNLINSNRWDDTDVTQGAGTAINQLGIAPLNNNSDYSTTGNYGYEWELSTAVTRSLRLTVNGSASSTYTDRSEYYPLTTVYMHDADRVNDFRRLLEDAGGSLDTNQKPLSNGKPVALAPGLAIPSPLPGKGPGLDMTNAVNAYNNIWTSYDQLATNPSRTHNTSSVNFFADYTVQTGKVRGLRVGAGFQWQGPTALNGVNTTNTINKGGWTIAQNVPGLGVVPVDDPTVNNTDLIWRWGSMKTQFNTSYTFRMKNNRALALALRINNIGSTRVRYGPALRQPAGDLTNPTRVTVFAGNPAQIVDPVTARFTMTYTFGGGGGR